MKGRSRAAPPIMKMKRGGIPAAKAIAAHSTIVRIAVERSGSRRMTTAGMMARIRVRRMPDQDCSRSSLRAMSSARMMISEIFATSEGWIVMLPTWIQRVAPNELVPVSSTYRSSRMIPTKSRRESPRQKW